MSCHLDNEEIPQKIPARLGQDIVKKEREREREMNKVSRVYSTPNPTAIAMPTQLSLLNCIQKCQRLGAICQPYYLCWAALLQDSQDRRHGKYQELDSNSGNKCLEG